MRTTCEIEYRSWLYLHESTHFLRHIRVVVECVDVNTGSQLAFDGRMWCLLCVFVVTSSFFISLWIYIYVYIYIYILIIIIITHWYHHQSNNDVHNNGRDAAMATVTIHAVVVVVVILLLPCCGGSRRLCSSTTHPGPEGARLYRLPHDEPASPQQQYI